MRNVLIVFLMAGCTWMGWRLADVERQRYALVTGICDIEQAQPRSLDCLATAEPRVSWLWNLYYGILGSAA